MDAQHDSLNALVDRIRSGTATPEDGMALLPYIRQGRLVAVTGPGAVGVGGNMLGGMIHTTEAEFVLQAAEVETVERLLSNRYPRRLYQLPPVPPDFVDRVDEITAITAELGRGSATIIAIASSQTMDGVGKTTLALRLATHLARSYPDAQLYFDLRGSTDEPRTARQAQTHVIKSFHPLAEIPNDDDELLALYRSILFSRNALLLMDDASDPAQVSHLIPPGNNVLLITSRRLFMLPGLRLTRLGALPPSEARQLLCRIVSNVGEEAGAIVALCGHLPAAIRVAGETLALLEGFNPAHYASRLRQERVEFDPLHATVRLSLSLTGASTQ